MREAETLGNDKDKDKLFIVIYIILNFISPCVGCFIYLLSIS